MFTLYCFVSVLALVVAIISLVLSIVANRKSRWAQLEVIWLFKQYKEVLKLSKETVGLLQLNLQ